MAVVAVRERGVVPYAQGRSFGSTGPYLVRRLTVEHLVDPNHEANQAIVDLEHAPRDDSGRVAFSHDVLELKPESGPGNGKALIDAVNRGRPTALRFLNQDHSAPFPPPPLPDPGDGHLLAEGWTLLLAGWQFDIDHESLLGLQAPEARPGGEVLRGCTVYLAQPPANTDRVRLALPGHRPPAAAEGPTSMEATGPDGLSFDVVADDRWSFSEDGRYALLDGGFQAGHRYRWNYTTDHSFVAGSGLLGLRDLAPWARETLGVEQAVLFGVSQCGRLIRQFLADGLNVDEQGRRAYEGVMPLIAGGRLGQFNQRFANPGTLPTGGDGLGGPVSYPELLASMAPEHRPKVMAFNTSTEYWRGDAWLVHPSTNGGAASAASAAATLAPDPASVDTAVSGPDEVRVHHIAGTQHTAGTVPQLFEDPYLGTKGQTGFSVVDYGPVTRALLDQLTSWIDHGTEPTPSIVPIEEQLSGRATVLARFNQLGWPIPDEASFGEPSGPVPALDNDGNEIGGIQLPDLAVPLGVHAGWNSRHADSGAPQFQLMLRGSTRWFPASERLARHQDRDAYLAAVSTAIDELIAQRLIRSDDRSLALSNAAARWDEATAQT